MDDIVKNALLSLYPNLKEYLRDDIEIAKSRQLDELANSIIEGQTKYVWFLGSVGVGKTTMAVYLLKRIIEIQFNYILSKARELPDDQIAIVQDQIRLKVNEMYSFVNLNILIADNGTIPVANLVVLDDIGWVEGDNKKIVAQLLGWGEKMYSNGNRAIITSNFDIKQILSNAPMLEPFIDRFTQDDRTKIIKIARKKSYRGV